LYQDIIHTNQFPTVDLFVEELCNHLYAIIEKFGGSTNFAGIGIGAPNGNAYTGSIEYAPNLHWKGIIPLAELIKIKTGIYTRLTNDANAAAIGEMKYGCTQNIKHFIMITLGTGVGSGIIINGDIVVGNDGFAGELGHTIIRPGGRLHSGTGMRGSLESYASATGVRDTAIELINNDPRPSTLRNYLKESITSQVVYDCAVNGDELANEVFEFTGKILGEALANFVMFSSPEMIVLFGGLTKAGDLIMNPTRKSMEENLLPIFKNKVKLKISSLNESDAAILGASALVF
jgi:glucokinase